MIQPLERRTYLAAQPFTEVGVDFTVNALFADKLTNDVYVANGTANTVIKYDDSQGKTVGVASLDAAGTAFAESKNGKHLFVSETSNNEIQEIATASMNVVKTITLSFSPASLTFGVGSELYIANAAPDSNSNFDVEQYSLSSGEITDSDVASFAQAPLLKNNKTAKRLFGTAINDYNSGQTIQRFDISGATPVALPAIPVASYALEDFDVAGGQGNAYSAAYGQNAVGVTALATSAQSTLAFPSGDNYAIALAQFPGITSLFATSYTPSTIVQYDETNGSLVQTYDINSLLSAGDYSILYHGMVMTANGDVVFASMSHFAPFTYGIGEIGLGTINFTDTPAIIVSNVSPLTASPAGSVPSSAEPSFFSQDPVIETADAQSLF